MGCCVQNEQVLAPRAGVSVKRAVFHEVTERAIKEAFEEPRELDMHLVHAQETRRMLDRLTGFAISPILWKKARLSRHGCQGLPKRNKARGGGGGEQSHIHD